MLLLALAVAGGAALLYVPENPKVVAVVPAILIGAVVCARWPAFALISLITMSGATGTLEAELSIPTLDIRDFLLAGLWLGAVLAHLNGRREPSYLWPALIGLILYVALTALEILTAPDTSAGLQSFRLAVWPMTAVGVIAFIGLSRKGINTVAKGIVAAGLLVGLYAVYRKIVGPSADEFAFAQSAAPELPPSEIRFFSSFPTAQHMSLWCSSLIPFALAVALMWTGRWRSVALAALPALAFAVFAADVRTGVAGTAIGVVVTLGLFAIAAPVPGGRRAASLVLAVALAAGIGFGAYAITVSGDDDTESRFERILTPGEDPTVDAREARWDRVLADAPQHPFGHGLGTTGSVLRGNSRMLFTPDLLFIDSTYVKVAYEQGIVVMVLFCLALFLVFSGLVVQVIRTADRESALYASGACGTLACLAVFFYSSNYIEQLQMILPWTIVGLAVAMAGRSLAERRAAPVQPGG